jgi:hypothetical protein
MLSLFYSNRCGIRVFVLMSFISLLFTRYGWTTGTDYLYAMYLELLSSFISTKIEWYYLVFLAVALLSFCFLAVAFVRLTILPFSIYILLTVISLYYMVLLGVHGVDIYVDSSMFRCVGFHLVTFALVIAKHLELSKSPVTRP